MGSGTDAAGYGRSVDATVVWQVYAILAAALLFVVTGFAAAVHAAKELVRRRRVRTGDAEPKCGRCGYIIHAGSAAVCPECGSRLATVGVVTPTTLRPAFPFLTLWLVSVIAVAVAFYAGPGLAARTPWGWRYYAWCLLYTSEFRQTRATTEGSFHIDARGLGRWWAHHPTRFHVDYKIPNKPDGWLHLEVLSDGTTGRLLGHQSLVGVPRVEPLDRQIFERLVKAAGFDPAAGEGATLSAALEQHTLRMLRRDWSTAAEDVPPVRILNGVMYSRDDHAGLASAAFAWVGIVGTTSLLLVRRYRRRRTRADAASAHLLDSLGLRP